MGLRELLKPKLTEAEMKMLITSFDLVGEICIIEIPDGLRKKQKIIAEAIMRMNGHIKTVYRKDSERAGVHRLWKLRLIRGKRMMATHKEDGSVYKLDVAKAYFSPREGTERQRIAAQVRPNETVLVMFAGVGPYAIAIARKQKYVEKVYAVEINRDACRYMRGNVKLNRMQDRVVPICGDVREKCAKLFGKCDRVIMPLPLHAYEFLPVAFRCIKPNGGIIHFYYWAPEKNLQEAAVVIEEAAKKAGRKLGSVSVHRVLPYRPRTFKVCVDAEVKKR
jgi:tRNA (guanine37-N1)-methyltransferase